MVNNINNFGVINFYENSSQKDKQQKVEDIQPIEETIDSIIFTKKAQKEGKVAHIIDALQQSVEGRKDKTRAFVQELHFWQKEGYIDPHFNAQVMYDELDKLMPLSFGYDVFKRYYNSTRD